MLEKQNKDQQKQLIDKIYYQKNAEKKREQRRNHYREKKKELATRVKKYSQVENYKVLITLKDYTELNTEKHKKWLEFSWTLQDLADTGIHNICEVMRLRETADILISDYWQTAKKEETKGKSWHSLPSKKQGQLIKLWAKEKAQREMAIAEGIEAINERGKEYEKEIEMAKFHQERGKIKCQCWECEEEKAIHKEVKAKIKKETKEAEKELDNYWGGAVEKEQCPECGRMVKELDEETGTCKKCLNKYGE